jgi:hypothetical protein
MPGCLYPIWIFLILSDITHPNRLLLFKLKGVKLFLAVLLIVIISGGFWLQLLNRFLINWWVA